MRSEVKTESSLPAEYAVGGCQYEYFFDTIGNRKTVNGGTRSVASAYTANSLNQYTTRTVPGKVLVTGEAETNATVSARIGTNAPAVLANRHGNHFWKAMDVDNTSAAFFTTNLKVTAHIASGTQSLLRAETRTAILPQTPEAFTHDADGNLTSDGLWTYSWDAENRLIAVESRSGAPAALQKRLTFRYDYMGRRIEKQIESGYSGGSYSTTNVITFVYDGWNIVSEISNSGFEITTNLYVWGLDLSGTLQGAGGIGGLLSITKLPSTGGVGGGSYFPCSDANGNITDYISTNGTVVAHREYDPFGGTIALTGSKKDDFTFWFSTKYWDNETGKGYWGHRYYDPVTGRWLSRYPIEELGLLLNLAVAKRYGGARSRE